MSSDPVRVRLSPYDKTPCGVKTEIDGFEMPNVTDIRFEAPILELPKLTVTLFAAPPFEIDLNALVNITIVAVEGCEIIETDDGKRKVVRIQE